MILIIYEKKTPLKTLLQSIGQQMCKTLDTIFDMLFLSLVNKNLLRLRRLRETQKALQLPF